MATWLITGSSRGLGLETARHLLATSSARIIATARDLSNAPLLDEMVKQYPGRIELVQLDISAPWESIQASFEIISRLEFSQNGIDVLLQNAGVAGKNVRARPSALDPKDLQQTLNTNVFGPIHIVQASLPLLRKGKEKRIYVTSSLMGSIACSPGPIATNYGISKAAINMFVKKLAQDLTPDGFIVIPFHPGYVKTDMNGGENGHGEITVKESVDQTFANVFSRTSADNGKFLGWDGEIVPW